MDIKPVPVEPRVVRLSSSDNLVVAVDVIDKGARVFGESALARVPKGHKMAIAPIAAGSPVVKFGQVIGTAKVPVAPGDWLHEHNVGMAEFERDYAFATSASPVPMVGPAERATFRGFRRDSGRF